MKVIFISNSSWNLFNFRIDLIKSLLKKKIKVYTIAPLDENTQKLKKIGCIHKNFRLKKRSLNPFNEIISFFYLLIIIYKIKPDFVLSFTIKPNIYSSIISKILKIKNIVNITGLGSSLLRRNILFYFVILIYKITISKSYMIFFQNNDDLLFFKKFNLIKNNNYSVIPGSGVNLNYFNISNFKEVNQDIDFLYVGRLIKDKGINEFCEASVKLMKEKSISLNVYVITHDEVKYNLYDKKFPEIIFKKKVLDIRNFYLRSKCTVLPSYREGTPKSLLESCAMKVPIIATNVPGCKEVLINNINGLFCKPYSSDNLAKIMFEYLNLSEQKKKMFSENARDIVEKKFDFNLVLNSYYKILNLEP